MREQLLCELTPLGIVEGLVKAQNTPTALQAVARHFEFVHGMNILDVQLDARSIRCLRSPHVQVFMPTRFKIECVVAIMKIRELREKPEVVFGVQLGVCSYGFKRRDPIGKRETNLF